MSSIQTVFCFPVIRGYEGGGHVIGVGYSRCNFLSFFLLLNDILHLFFFLLLIHGIEIVLLSLSMYGWSIGKLHTYSVAAVVAAPEKMFVHTAPCRQL